MINYSLISIKNYSIPCPRTRVSSFRIVIRFNYTAITNTVLVRHNQLVFSFSFVGILECLRSVERKECCSDASNLIYFFSDMTLMDSSTIEVFQ